MSVEVEVQHLCSIAEVYKKSGIGTLNIYNLLRASGLYNICLVSIPSRISKHVHMYLVNFT